MFYKRWIIPSTGYFIYICKKSLIYIRRTLLTLTLLLCTLVASAQIQRKFLGFTIGVTSKTTVYNYLRNNNIKFSKNEKDEYLAKKIKFAGEVWDYVWFSFYNGKLYNLDFYIDEDSTPIQTMDLIYNRLDYTLSNKYASYFDYNKSTSERKVYNDNITKITFRYEYIEGSKSIAIMYTYLPLLNHKLSSDADEL